MNLAIDSPFRHRNHVDRVEVMTNYVDFRRRGRPAVVFASAAGGRAHSRQTFKNHDADLSVGGVGGGCA